MKKYLRIIFITIISFLLVACAGTSDSGVPVSATMEEDSLAESLTKVDSLAGFLAEGEYPVTLVLEGGTGKAHVDEASTLMVNKDQVMMVRVVWSSPNYDYMIVDGDKYLPINTEGNSEFEIPVPALDEPFDVIGDTVAMSTPHEIAYRLTVSVANRAENSAPNTGLHNNHDDITDVNINDNVDSSALEAWINENLTNKTEIPIEYAKGFSIDRYDILEKNEKIEVYIIQTQIGAYAFYVNQNDSTLELSPIPNGVTQISSVPKNIYVVGTGSMDYFRVMGALEQVKFTSLKADDWHIPEIGDFINSGKITYAGKYAAPDYEMLLSGGCDLIVENTMISHKPEVLLQLKNLGFPVIIDSASYEDTVLGRMEWIKLYGLLTGHMEDAERIFELQKKKIEVAAGGSSAPKVGFFSLTSAGTVSVRRNNDYVVDIIEMAGGEYGFADLLGEDGTGSTTIQMEAFYSMARECDILIYNSTIEGEINSKDDLVSRCELIKNCEAFKNDQIYCTSSAFYQSVMELGDVTQDISKIINDLEKHGLHNSDNYTYFVRIE